MTTRELVAWGAGRTMSDLEAVFWRAECDPQLRSGGVVLELLDTAPDWDRLVAAHAWAVSTVPRLRQRVVDDPLRIGAPRWTGTEVDLGYHLTRVRLPDGGGRQALLDLAAAMHMEPLDPTRPLWRAVLVDGLPDGEAAYLLKIHHSMADGTAAVQLFDLLHGRTRTAGNRTTAAAAPVAEPPLLPQDVLLANARELVDAVPHAVLRGARGTARSLTAVLARPERAVTAAAAGAHFARSAIRVGRGSGAAPSPLLTGRGVSRRLRVLEAPLPDLKAAGRAAGGSLNDAFLAVVLGGLGRYHEKHGTAVQDVPMALPVSLRRPADSLGGNRFAAAGMAGPAGEPDPARRIRLVHARVAAARGEPALDLMGAAAPVASRLPGRVLAGVAGRMSRSLDLQASSITGLQRDAYLAGARITRMFVFGPAPGSALMATLLSHQDICCLALTTDHDAVPDPDVLLACVQDELDAVLALG